MTGLEKVAVETLVGNGSKVEWFEVENVREFATHLKAQGLTKFCRYSRCPATYDGTVVGSFNSLEDLTEADITWASTPIRIESRRLLCAER